MSPPWVRGLRAGDSRRFPGSTRTLARREQGRPPSRRGAQRGRLTCVAASRARTSRIRKGSRPRPAVQKNRAPAAGRQPESVRNAAMTARARPRGSGSRGLGARAAHPRVPGGVRGDRRAGWSPKPAGGENPGWGWESGPLGGVGVGLLG